MTVWESKGLSAAQARENATRNHVALLPTQKKKGAALRLARLYSPSLAMQNSSCRLAPTMTYGKKEA
jgi:hypothetical protein